MMQMSWCRDEIWISYVTGKHLRHLAAHEIAKKTGEQKAKALPLFHAITGCDDTVYFFGGKGKKTAVCMAVIERFVVLLHDRTSAMVEVNRARKNLFSKKARNLESIPPTRAALEQHKMRAVFQGT